MAAGSEQMSGEEAFAAASPVGGPTGDLLIRDLTERRELQDLVTVLGLVWRRPDGVPPMNTEVLLAVVHAGAMVLGAFEAGRLVGGAVGFVGLQADDHISPAATARPVSPVSPVSPAATAGSTRSTGPVRPLRMHSHIVGVRPEARGRSVGTALKWQQRRWCLERGIGEITWTFDPLIRRNTWLNIGKLGAVGTHYHEDFYGPMSDGFNAGLPTDRCVATWLLDSTRVRAAAAGRAPVPAVAELRARGATVVLAPDADGEPASGTHPTPSDSAGPCRLIRLPGDVHALRHRDPDLVLRWRLALRRAMVDGLRDGLRLWAVSRDGWYVLTEGRR